MLVRVRIPAPLTYSRACQARPTPKRSAFHAMTSDSVHEVSRFFTNTPSRGV